MPFTMEVLMGLIYKSITTNWPSGQADVIVVLLHKKYSPKDLVSTIKLRCNLNSIIMKKDEDPDHLSEKLSGLENRYSTALFQISTKDLIATVLKKAPMEYGTIFTCKQRAKGNMLTTVHLNQAMSQLYWTMYQSDKKN
eukprot:10442806-Ditylum_brightwellii.AAC.1